MIPSCLALDIGTERVGIAINVGSLVLPKEVVPRGELKVWLQENAPPFDYLVVGLPIDLRGEQGPAAKNVLNFLQSLELNPHVTLRFVDERLTTALAARRLRESGRNSKSSRQVVDAQAAAEILEAAISLNPSLPGKGIDEF